MVNLVLSLLRKYLLKTSLLGDSKIFNESTFYKQFVSDLKRARREVIIESPYITSQRMYYLWPVFESLVAKRVKIYVFTMDPVDHDEILKLQAETEIRKLESIGIQVIISTNNGHRKLAIIDRRVLWEGSLNILSQIYSREFMRRIDSEVHSEECFKYVNLGKFIY